MNVVLQARLNTSGVIQLSHIWQQVVRVAADVMMVCWHNKKSQPGDVESVSQTAAWQCVCVCVRFNISIFPP